MTRAQAVKHLMLGVGQLSAEVAALSLAGRDGTVKRNARVKRMLRELERVRALPDDAVVDDAVVIALVLSADGPRTRPSAA